MDQPKNIIPSNQISIYEQIRLTSQLSQLAIIRPSNPPPGIGGFLFDMDTDQEFEFASDITDHYIEDNTAINDQIALKPEIVTLRGFVAELTDISTKNKDIIATIYQPLSEIPEFVPKLTVAAEQILKEANENIARANSAAASSQSLYGTFNDKSPIEGKGKRQSHAFQYFYALWKGRQLVTAETPWGFMQDMAILQVRAVQSRETKYESDFVLVLKKLRFAQELSVNVGQLAGRLAFQKAPTTENGNAGQKKLSPEEEESLLYSGLKSVIESVFGP